MLQSLNKIQQMNASNAAQFIPLVTALAADETHYSVLPYAVSRFTVHHQYVECW